MLRDGLGEPRRNQIERLVPACLTAVDFGMKQSAVEPDRLGERRPLGAEAAKIGGMIGVTTDDRLPARVDLRQQTAADPTIRAGGPYDARLLRLFHLTPPGSSPH